jgi:flagellar basal-body rod modification protein FlgD
MSVSGTGGGAPLGTNNPFSAMSGKAQTRATDEKNMSIGERLNQMSGVQNEDSLYKPKTEMGKEAFLKLFMEQLKYQDPMNPVKNDQFNQQMAMFSQLEQQVNMNKTLEKMLGQQNNMQIAALQLVGKNITADRGALYHEKDKFTSMTFKLPEDVKNLKLEIIDPIGEPVRTYELEGRPEGEMSWKWDGQDDQGIPMPPGRYSYRVSGKGLDDKEVKVNNRVEGRVSGVTSSGGIVYLMVGEQKIGLNDVEMIKEGAEPGSSSAASATNPSSMSEILANGAKPMTPAEKLGAVKNLDNSPPAVSAPSAPEKNWDLSHDSFEDLPNESDKETIGMNRETENRVSKDSGGMPPVMPLFMR